MKDEALASYHDADIGIIAGTNDCYPHATQFDRLQAIADANRREQQSYNEKQQQLQAEIEQVRVSCVHSVFLVCA